MHVTSQNTTNNFRTQVFIKFHNWISGKNKFLKRQLITFCEERVQNAVFFKYAQNVHFPQFKKN